MKEPISVWYKKWGYSTSFSKASCILEHRSPASDNMTSFWHAKMMAFPIEVPLKHSDNIKIMQWRKLITDYKINAMTVGFHLFLLDLLLPTYGKDFQQHDVKS